MTKTNNELDGKVLLKGINKMLFDLSVRKQDLEERTKNLTSKIVGPKISSQERKSFEEVALDLSELTNFYPKEEMAHCYWKMGLCAEKLGKLFDAAIYFRESGNPCRGFEYFVQNDDRRLIEEVYAEISSNSCQKDNLSYRKLINVALKNKNLDFALKCYKDALNVDYLKGEEIKSTLKSIADKYIEVGEECTQKAKEISGEKNER